MLGSNFVCSSYSVISPRLFKLSSQLIFLGAQNKTPLGRCQERYCIQIFGYNFTNILLFFALSSVFPCPVTDNDYLCVISQLWPDDACVQALYCILGSVYYFNSYYEIVE